MEVFLIKLGLIMEKYEFYSLEEIAEKIAKSLEENGLPYTVERQEDSIVIWLDREHNFGCEICGLHIAVFHMEGSRLFNLDEGKELDALSTQEAMKHLLLIASHTLFQEDTYKGKRLCSSRQYVIREGNQFFCSTLWIKHILFFVPFLKKEVKIKAYTYQREE